MISYLLLIWCMHNIFISRGCSQYIPFKYHSAQRTARNFFSSGKHVFILVDVVLVCILVCILEYYALRKLSMYGELTDDPFIRESHYIPHPSQSSSFTSMSSWTLHSHSGRPRGEAPSTHSVRKRDGKS